MDADKELTKADLQSLSSRDNVVSFFAALGYSTDARLPQTSAAMGITAESLLRQITHIERIALQDHGAEPLDVYLIELSSVTVAATQGLARALRNRAGNYLLVLTDDYERLDFVLIERSLPVSPATPITPRQVSVRPRILTVHRRNPSPVQMRVLRRFTYTEADSDAQYDKLLSAYDVAEWSEPLFNNRALFSDYYLTKRLPEREEWRRQHEPLYHRLKALLTDARQRLGGQGYRVTWDLLLGPAFEALGFRAESAAGTDGAKTHLALYSGDGSSAPLVLCLSYAWNRNLDGRDETRDAETPEDNPGARVVELLGSGQAPWAIVTNGKVWRLYSARAHSRATNYYEIDLEETLAMDDPGFAFRYFSLFFGAGAFIPRSVVRDGQSRRLSFLEELVEESEDYAKDLGERLKTRIFEDIFPHFAEGFIEYLRSRPPLTGAHQEALLPVAQQLALKQEPDEAYRRQVFEGTLTFLYRLLFVLYAESRGLLPVREERGYWEHSLSRLKEETAGKAGSIEDEAPRKLRQAYRPDSTLLYDRLLDLFRHIDKGSREMNLPHYNGGLFLTEPDPGDHSAEAENARFLLENKIPDRCLTLGLDLMARDIDPKRQDLVFIDYKSLGVRQLGSIYEGLLEFKVRIAQEKMAIVQGKKTEEIIPYKEAVKSKKKILTAGRGRNAEERTHPAGKVYLENDRRERKATGSYYTPDHIVRYIVEHTVGPVLEEKFEKMRPTFREAQQAYRNAEKRAEGFRKQGMKPDDPAKVANTYRHIVDELFDLRVLDPAMGSGHFLVEAVDFICDRILGQSDGFLRAFPANPVTVFLDDTRQAILAEMERQGVAIDASRLTDINLLKRHVLKRCIYGVDLNPMAVELAKVSLWLDCFTLGAPLSFLDHHLKCGNSLIGTTVQEVEVELAAQTRGKGYAGDLFGGPFQGLLSATALMEELRRLPDATVEQAERSHSLFADFEKAQAPYKAALDIWVSRHFGNKLAQEYLTLAGSDLVEQIHSGGKRMSSEYREVISKAAQLSQQNRFFHWDLEFPEAFVDLERGNWKSEQVQGFDAIVGNPPYRKADEDLSWQELRYRIMALGRYRTLHQKWDLYIPFIELASQVSRFGCRFSMITQNSLEIAPYASKCRNFMFAESTLKELHFFPDLFLFEEAGVQNTVFVCAKLCPTLPYAPMRLMHEKQTAPWLFTELPPRMFSNADEAFQAKGTALEFKRPYVPLGKLCYINKGGTLQSHDIKYRGEFVKDDLLSNTRDHRHPKSYTEGKFITDITVDRVLYLEYGRGTRNPDRVMEPRFHEMFENPKLIFGKTSGVVIDFESLWCDQSGRVAIPFHFLTSCDASSVLEQMQDALAYESKKYDLGYLLIIARSSIGRRHLTQKSTDTRDVTPDTIKRLPIPLIEFTTAADNRREMFEQGRKLHDADPCGLVAFVEQRLAAQPEESDVVHDLLAYLAQQMIDLNKHKQAEQKRFLSWLEGTLRTSPDSKGNSGLDALTGKSKLRNYLGDYQKDEPELSHRELESILNKNRSKLGVSLSDERFSATLKAEYEKSLAVLRPIKDRLAATDNLIDQIVYRLYGLTDEEIAIVEAGTRIKSRQDE